MCDRSYFAQHVFLKGMLFTFLQLTLKVHLVVCFLLSFKRFLKCMHFSSPTLFKRQMRKSSLRVEIEPRHWFGKKNVPPPPKVLWDTQYGISGLEKKPSNPQQKKVGAQKTRH